MNGSLLSKAELTRAQILDSAVDLARHGGLESLTIGAVADRAGLSKSGVFSRVGSREELQIAALKEYERRFIEQVIAPSLREPRGLPRMRELLRRWLARMADQSQGGCLFVAGAFEYDDRPGPMRDAIVDGLQQMRRHLARTIQQAVDEGQMPRGVDTEQMAFEICSLMLGVHHDTRLFGEKRAAAWALAGVERILAAPLR